MTCGGFAHAKEGLLVLSYGRIVFKLQNSLAVHWHSSVQGVVRVDDAPSRYGSQDRVNASSRDAASVGRIREA
jgi:hypothetical protein